MRATPDNGLFGQLKIEWAGQLQSDEDAPIEYYTPMMEHAESISGENPQDSRYGIFVLADIDDDGSVLACEGLVHINHAWPKSKDPVLRLVWNLIAPKYQYADDLIEPVARIMTGFITESLKLCWDDMPSRELKIYLGNAIDREYATIAASIMQTTNPDFGFAVHGNWLHISVADPVGG